jgi:carboxyl-terminal processing protease
VRFFRALPFLLWVSINFVLTGTLGFYLFYGPGNVSDERLAIAAGVLTGLIFAGLWAWQGRLSLRGRSQQARRLGWTIGLLPWLVAIPLAVLAVTELRDQGYFAPPATQSRAENFDRLWLAIDRRYPYFAEKGIDWPAVRERYRLQLDQADTDAAYHQLVSAMLAELNDGHSALENTQFPVRFGLVEEIEGQAVITSVGPSAQAVGIQPGDILLALRGKTTGKALEDLPAPLRTGSTPWNARSIAFSHLLDVPRNRQLAVTVRSADGTLRDVTIQQLSTPAANPPAPAPGPVIQGRQLESGVGVIRVPRLSGDGLTAQFDQALDNLMDAPGIILDLRGNGGGSSMIGDAIAGRFLSERFYYGVETFRRRLPLQAFRKTSTYRVLPREPVYTGPLVLILDAQTFSSAEMLAVVLIDSGRAQSVGQVTGGGSGNPVRFHLTGGGVARYSTGAFRRNNGQLIEGVGIAPGVLVSRTLAAYRAGRDETLEQAEAIILGR